MRFLKTTLLALGAATLLAAPAQAWSGAANPENCTPTGKLAPAFTPFGDGGLYTPVANAGLENATDDWTLTGGAAVTDGNEPWFIGANPADSHALDLPAGSSATTARICIAEPYTHRRLFARTTGSGGELRIEVLSFDSKGRLTSGRPF